MSDSKRDEKAKDTGLAIVLILLLFIYLSKVNHLLLPAIIVLVVTMTCPGIFRVPGELWFGFSHFLGGIVSKVLLAAVFYILVTPIGLLRKLGGADAMKKKVWKRDALSVFAKRDHLFVREDLENPY